MKWQVIKIRVLRWFRRVVLYGLYGLVLFTLTSFLLLQIPAVQENIIGRYIKKFSSVSGFNLSLESVYLVWYDHLQIKGLRIEDPEGNTMISAGSLAINFRISSLWNNQDINIDAAAIDSASVNIIRIQESDTSRNLNINIFVDRINKMAASDSGTGKSPKVNIGEIILDRSAFSYNDTDADSLHHRFDHNHFRLALNGGEMDNFKVIGDTIQFNVNSLLARDQETGLEVKRLKTFFRISQTDMEFYNLQMDAGQSKISDTIVFSYKSQKDFSQFNTKVSMKALLKDTYIHPADLDLFAPGTLAIGQPLLLNGKITGRVNKLSCSQMDIRVGNTSLSGKLNMDGLPQLNETFITADLKNSRVNINDLHFLFSDMVFDRLRPLGSFRLQGTFTGFVNDFVANASIDAPIGSIISNINLKVNEQDVNQSLYQGDLQLINFNLGSYLKDTTTFQRVSMKGNIKGSGLTYSTANFVLDGSVPHIGVLGYDYVNINTNARFSSQFFSGTMRINDPNLKFNATGSLDFRKGANLINITANLDTALLHNIGFSRQKFFVRSFVEIHSQGLEIDSLFGDALFKNTTISYHDKTVELDSIHVISEMQNDERKITLRSSMVDGSLQGNYYYSSLFNDLSKLYQEFLLGVRNDQDELDDYYRNKRKSTQTYEATIDLQLHDVNQLLELAGLDLEISRETHIEGRFSNGLTSILHAFSSIDTVKYQDHIFTFNEIEVTGSKIRDSANVLAMVTVNSARQELSKSLVTKNLLVEAIWNRDHVNLGVDVDQEGLENSLRLRSEIDFLRDSTHIRILPSRIEVLQEEWIVDPNNFATLKGKELTIQNLEIQHGEESVLLDGIISPDPAKALILTISNLNLDLLDNFSMEKFTGVVNGTISGKDMLRLPSFQNNVEIRDLTINAFLVGNIFGINEWNPEEKKFDINFSIDRLSERTMSLTGTYDPALPENPLNLRARFNKTNLKIIEPLMRGIFSQMNGELTGLYTLRGTLARPSIRGEGNVQKGQIMIDYLKTLYSFTGKLDMSPNQIIFTDFELTDMFNNKGTLDGYVAHKNFGKFTINLDGSFTNFQLLNTSSKDNSLFYGQGYATGKMNIFGPSSNLKISSTARTEKNTKIYIPVSGTEEVAQKDFITFDHFSDSLSSEAPIVTIKQRELTGITLDFNIDITPAAYAEIIFDIKAGDIIRGRGNGDIKLQLDTKGEFNMFGGIEFTEGAYNFTLADIINKEFSIKPGSRITWYGDPYQGILDITASYRQLTSLAPIFTDPTLASDPALRRKYPVEVRLDLDGAMLSPQINFDLVPGDIPSNIVAQNGTPIRLSFEFNAFKAKLDEQELKRQVFSLIVLRRLSPPDAFSTSGTLANSVSELLSNQLSYWITQVDQNLEIDLDFDLGTMDQETFNTFQLRLSYSFLNGRLRITRDGTFSNQTQQQQSVASLAGDWTVDYLLTPDGKFRVKMYNRSNFNAVMSSIGAQNTVTTGFSLMHTQSFNEIKDLLHSSRDRQKKQMTEPEEEIENEILPDVTNY